MPDTMNMLLLQVKNQLSYHSENALICSMEGLNLTGISVMTFIIEKLVSWSPKSLMETCHQVEQCLIKLELMQCEQEAKAHYFQMVEDLHHEKAEALTAINVPPSQILCHCNHSLDHSSKGEDSDANESGHEHHCLKHSSSQCHCMKTMEQVTSQACINTISHVISHACMPHLDIKSTYKVKDMHEHWALCDKICTYFHHHNDYYNEVPEEKNQWELDDMKL
ncbi:hypothetical protein FQN50_008582 [Emmonsiellopsis sp. PD_5]|nr:hypothetical protein FQN50_008582 [Emmonsiellopsis sp. PD_5]